MSGSSKMNDIHKITLWVWLTPTRYTIPAHLWMKKSNFDNL